MTTFTREADPPAEPVVVEDDCATEDDVAEGRSATGAAVGAERAEVEIPVPTENPVPAAGEAPEPPRP